MKLSEISDRIEKARTGANIWENVKLLAVSKNVDTNAVENLFSQGQMDFGENRVQELKRKCEILVDLPLKWHFIGTLQKNKINQLITLKPVLWQSCNSFELAVAVDKRLDYRLDTLLEINVANEDSKSGISADEAIDTYRKIKAECKNLNLVGVMSIGAHSDDLKEIIKSFELTYKIFENLQKSGAAICSMGMSADFETAIKCGSNMVRLGRILYA
ncbi:MULTISPECIES: YggS family pyridoxal phosphate-dependent enzyme [Campylobacter]|uniref:YggS family pyridoxal phosphate-dependent enzyme n=1 Tax=Campylobacter TaxID=194 RepID=UPI0023F3CB25|nr:MULTISPECIES: YggS family pyridoxal phosphate-dependent enzyme [Campylobacter]MCI6641005.1 YggS family pyridoxal phosphate-dependent enzyme [Campylobacter sp.]MDD7422667.1 YggS family pyridoxal phosphate-dependent enzyme [Campylobacter hominis]MDY3117638.1 YggS family pyridoxal phosphate-dependent enzyme [Campylobacter hominis]